MRSSDWSSDVCSSDLKRWVVYAKPPFAGPEAVLAYLSRYTHRVAISKSSLLRFDDPGVTFRYKDYRKAGAGRKQVMTLAADDFLRSQIGSAHVCTPATPAHIVCRLMPEKQNKNQPQDLTYILQP